MPDTDNDFTLPNLAHKISKADVDKKGKADYINWATTLQRLRDEAPGWMPEVQENSENGSWLFPSPKGCSVRVRFRHINGFTTPWVMQALMDFKNGDIAFANAGDVAINKAVMRGTCKAAAVHFGLAQELWAKDPIEDVYDPSAADTAKPAAEPVLGNSQPVAVTQAEPSSDNAAPTKDSVVADLGKHPGKADISKAFLAEYYGSYTGSLKKSHITTDDHVLFLHDLINGWKQAA